MSNELSFKERVERQARTAAKSRPRSSSPVEVRIELPGELPLPVTLALLLCDSGLGLARAHAAVTELADRHTTLVIVRPQSIDTLLAGLSDLRLVAKVQPQARAV